MHIQLPFKGTKEEGKARIVSLLAEHDEKIAREASQVSTEWKDDILEFSFVSRGMRFSGSVEVRDAKYDITVILPLSLRLFEGTIERKIREEVEKLKPQDKALE